MTITENSAATTIPHDYSKRAMVFGGRSSQDLAAKIAGKLSLSVGDVTLKTFSDGEIYGRYEESIRGADVFLVQSTCANVETGMTPNDALMELMIMADAAQGASAHRIIAVMPWFGYARQDKKSAPREPITSRVVARSLEAVGIDRVLTMDLHAGQIQGFFDIPTDNLYAVPVLARDVRSHYDLSNVMVVSPDVGGVVRARALAKRINAPIAICDKRRDRPGESEVMNVIGEVEGKRCILIDDIVDSGGTLCNAAEALLKNGATEVMAYITHGVLSGGAVARIAASRLKTLVITDSILPTEAVRLAQNIRVLSIAPLMGEAIARTAREESVSCLFY